MMVAALAVTGFVSCSNDDDDDDNSDSTPATTLAGTYYVNESASVASASVPATGAKLVVEKSTDTTVDITLPGISYTMGTTTMTIASFKIEGVKVSSDDSENYTFTLGTFSSTATSDSSKTITGTSVSGTYVKSTGKINLTAVYKYGSMPMTLTDAFDNSELVALYGTYTGSMTVMGTASEVSLTIANGSFTLNSGHPGTYTKILWLKDTNSNYVLAAQSDDTNTKNGDLTVDNYTTAASNYVVFGTDAITYYVPAMASMGGTSTLTKSE